ncbi:MAG: NUDIX hydrolase [Paraperlucidibaca sp.]|nr:NUDIX hydrolase [Paraperlucidibaca sp.]MBQ0723141.1 NUDIX hydrolase [Paraperlucidibaca sp.]MBQ0842974.1 NUDIX hydrolase [Paraperlucidibaca sp.]
MKFCSNCGSQVTQRIPEGDSRPRYICDDCNIVHYQNPNIIAGCLPVWGDKVLLCRRAIEPRYGFWTLPAGFMENGETVAEGAARETWEEAEADVRELTLYTVFNIPYINQVYMLHRAYLVDGKFGIGVESLECQLFDEADIPWDELAFPSVKRTLRYYFEDRQRGEFPLHIDDLRPPVKS